MILFLLFFFGTGLIFGSFSTVLIERWHSGKSGILMGRSECPHCNHILGGKDLFPLFSYLWNRGKCRYCNVPISAFYPLAEMVMGTIFCLLGYSIIRMDGNIVSIDSLLLLVFGFVTGVYILYDLRYMEIPDQIMVPAIYLLIGIPFFGILFTGDTFHISIYNQLFGAWILYTFFYLQILLPGGYHLMKNKDWKNLTDLSLGYFTFPITLLIDFFRKKPEDNSIEIPTWIGGGDLRVALFIGLTLGTLHGVASFAFAYIIGSIVGIFILVYNALLSQKTTSQIPFGPFLGIGWLLSIFFYPEIIIYYNTFIIGQ